VLAALALTACDGGGTARPAPVTPLSGTPTPSPSVTASPSPSPERTFTIGVLGDYGVDAAAIRAVTGTMRRWHPDAVVTTGDNAYCCGTLSQEQFAKRMLDTVGAPVHAAIGNHDVLTGNGAPFLQVFGAKRWYTAEVGPVQFVVLDSNQPANATQLAFLKKVLAQPRPGAFRVVVFHHPAWSCSYHDPSEGVRTRWLPLFGTKVDLVLAGHNHTYERFRAAHAAYVTTGGGGASLYPSARLACRGAGRVVTYQTVHHALRLRATSTALTVEAIGTDGKAFDRFTLRR